MSKTDVASFKEFGPYIDVKVTGGVETFNAVFRNKKANISFIFDEKGLKRIQVWIYEGENKENAAKAWANLYTFMKESFGPIELPQLEEESKNQSLPPEVMGIIAMVKAGLVGKVQMAPKSMPPNVFVYSSFATNRSIENPVFYLMLFYDRT